MTDYLSVGPANKWNYSDPNQPGFSPTLTGTLVEVIVRQSRNFQTKQLEYWDDGNPKISYTLVIQDANGNEWPWTLDRGSNAFKELTMAIHSIRGASLKDLGGMLIEVSTSGLAMVNGRTTRQWSIKVLGQGTAEYRGEQNQLPTEPAPVSQPANNVPAPAQQPQQAPAPQAQPAGAPPIVGGYYAAPTVAPATQAAPAPVPAPAQPVPAQPTVAPQAQPMAPAPQAAPAPTAPVAPAAPAAMPPQVVGEQVPVSIYDQDIPF